MNVVFCSYLNTKSKKGFKDVDEFLDNVESFMSFEIMYSFFQMIKVLHFMNLEYKHLWEQSVNSDKMRNALYKEDTNVLSYYVITLILIYNYQSFLSWCQHHNKSLLQFNKTAETQMEFCHFIETKYKSQKFSHGIKCVTNLFQRVKVAKGVTNKSNKNKSNKSRSKSNHDKVNSKKDIDYLYNNLRMTLCELG
jgi:hypothetical protein